MEIKDLFANLEDIFDYQQIWYLNTPEGIIVIGLALICFVFTGLCFLKLLYDKWVLSRIRPCDTALSELVQLEKEYKNGQKNLRELYFGLTGIARLIVLGNFKINISGKTDNEILTLMRTNNLKPELIQIINDLFARAESVKFASLDIAEEKIVEDLDSIKSALKEWAAQPK